MRMREYSAFVVSARQFSTAKSEMSFSSVVASYNVSSTRTDCSMSQREEGEMNIVATLRLIMASMSILGAMSIVGSATYRRTVCSPKVHPIFVLAIVDALLSLLWISGAVVWLRRGGAVGGSTVGCFSINLLTVILQCATMNVTLIYALLAYSSIKQRDFNGVYMVQDGSVSAHVWHPLCSFFAYIIAWILPVVLVMVPFAVLSGKYGLVQKANECSCWCVPFYGNVLPRLQLGSANNEAQEEYKLLLHKFITSYSVVLTANFAVVLCTLAVVYTKVLLRIRHIRITQANNERTPLQGATQATLLAGQRDARTRVTFFLAIFFLTGIITFSFGVSSIVTQTRHHHHHSSHHHTSKTLGKYYTFLFFEAILVPIQGFLNALAYGWTRGGFVSAMRLRNSNSRPRPRNSSLSISHEVDDARDTDDKEKGHYNSSL